jgi:hypothetical protein
MSDKIKRWIDGLHGRITIEPSLYYEDANGKFHRYYTPKPEPKTEPKTEPEPINYGNWQPIYTAPNHEWVEVRGLSGMESPKYFLALALLKQGPSSRDIWIDVQYENLADRGWTPLEWRPTDPDMKE